MDIKHIAMTIWLSVVVLVKRVRESNAYKKLVIFVKSKCNDISDYKLIDKLRYVITRRVNDSVYYVKYDIVLNGYILCKKQYNPITHVYCFTTIAIYNTLSGVERTLRNEYNIVVKL